MRVILTEIAQEELLPIPGAGSARKVGSVFIEGRRNTCGDGHHTSGGSGCRTSLPEQFPVILFRVHVQHDPLIVYGEQADGIAMARDDIAQRAA